MSNTDFNQRKAVQRQLDEWLEVEFTFRETDELIEPLFALPVKTRRFVLNWVERIASAHTEMAYQFALKSTHALTVLDEAGVESWLLFVLEQYDRSGLQPAMAVIHDVENFQQHRFERESGSLYEKKAAILTPFVRGLSGRALKLEVSRDDSAWTDSETLYLPALVARLSDKKDNFLLHKAMAAHLWAQTRFGTFQCDWLQALSVYPDPRQALALFHALETIRLDSCISRYLPGLYREMQRLRAALDDTAATAVFARQASVLQSASAQSRDSLQLLGKLYGDCKAPVCCYQGRMEPQIVQSVMRARQQREKALIRVKLAEMAEEHARQKGREPTDSEFDIQQKADDELNDHFEFELSIQEDALTVPPDLAQMLTSVMLDFSEIPNEYLTPAGPGEYDLSAYDETAVESEDVWKGAYHEEGASLHQEWDFARQCHRKQWCVMRELEVKPLYDDFYQQTMQKHARLIKSLHRTFEMLRGEDKLLKRQTYGDEVDIDALVEAYADTHYGLEMSDRLFTHKHKVERNIAVMFMVDMSGSTKGWINDAERESLFLLAESLQILGDRYAIYGFSGVTRKRCELFRIKSFDDAYDAETRARISGIEAKDYTRMGVAIRHLSGLLNQVEARIKLLITLSDGKPEDYDGYYRGEYGIEDTRMALYEARRDGVHPYCITIDKEGQDYLPHMYGAANYTVLEDVAMLPLKVSDIYRRLTT
ncbi:MAG: nitric oxide reductase activation protein [gamma proteobacterium symbiont of Bathyaustriella thionipta]|nr:nitric oxide reductase activation protein [gamma proteobacterium symbiont of Bathyaustriella thionipta]